MKLWAKIFAGLVVIVIAAIIAIPFFVDANTFRPTLETRLSAGLGRPVKLGNLRLSLLSGSLVADNLSVADDPAFSTTPLLTAREERIGVDMKPRCLIANCMSAASKLRRPRSIWLRARMSNGTSLA